MGNRLTAVLISSDGNVNQAFLATALTEGLAQKLGVFAQKREVNHPSSLSRSLRLTLAQTRNPVASFLKRFIAVLG